MRQQIKKLLISLIPNQIKKNYRVRIYNHLVKAGYDDDQPTHWQKQAHIYYHQQKYELNTLLETGTYLGEMVSAMRYFFTSIYSIELSKKLAKEAQNRFGPNQHIRIVQGDSATQLKLVLNQLSEPVLFWLDGHYSGGQTAKGVKECPILEELEAIASFKCNAGSVVLIDDARLFNGSHDYPEVETIQKWVNEYLPSHQMHQDFDAICIVPKS